MRWMEAQTKTVQAMLRVVVVAAVLMLAAVLARMVPGLLARTRLV